MKFCQERPKSADEDNQHVYDKKEICFKGTVVQAELIACCVCGS